MSKELNILIIEDVATDAEAIERELKENAISFQASRLETKQEFLKALRHAKPDIILSDFTLPEFDALEALRLLQDQHYDIPFILVTGTRSEEVAVECLRLGADDYILKASLKRLPASVLNALRKKKAEREKARAEAALRSSEEQFRLIAEHSQDLICLLDLKGCFLYASPAFRLGLGYAPKDLLGHVIFSYVHPLDKSRLQQSWEQALDRRGSYTAEFRTRHGSGEWRFLEASGNWIFDEKGHPQRSVIVCRDITRRKRSEEALRSLPKLIRDAQEAERRRVARELHDSVIQILSSAKFRMQSVEETLATLDEQTHLESARASGLLERAIREVRRISRDLRPSELDDLGLVAAVRSLSNEFQERVQLPVRLILERPPESLPADLELNVYRVIQEGVTNIEKHAHATEVELSLKTRKSLLQVTIRDNGRGFDLDEVKARPSLNSGMGLVDIEERARMVGGSVTLHTAPDQGTTIVLDVPLPGSVPKPQPARSHEKRKKKKNSAAAGG